MEQDKTFSGLSSNAVALSGPHSALDADGDCDLKMSLHVEAENPEMSQLHADEPANFAVFKVSDGHLLFAARSNDASYCSFVNSRSGHGRSQDAQQQLWCGWLLDCRVLFWMWCGVDGVPVLLR